MNRAHVLLTVLNKRSTFVCPDLQSESAAELVAVEHSKAIVGVARRAEDTEGDLTELVKALATTMAANTAVQNTQNGECLKPRPTPRFARHPQPLTMHAQLPCHTPAWCDTTRRRMR